MKPDLLAWDEPVLSAAELALRADPFLPLRETLHGRGGLWSELACLTERDMRAVFCFDTVYPRAILNVYDDVHAEDDYCGFCGMNEWRTPGTSTDAFGGDSPTFQALCAADDALVAYQKGPK